MEHVEIFEHIGIIKELGCTGLVFILFYYLIIKLLRNEQINKSIQEKRRTNDVDGREDRE